MTATQLSIIDAMREGRELYPQFVSGQLITLMDSAGDEVHYDFGDGCYYKYDPDGEEIPATGKVTCGSSCILGAAGLGMGLSLGALTTEDGFYAHPDFFVDEADKATYPNGFTYNGESYDVPLRRVAYPCDCNDLVTPDFDGVEITQVVAHLNDAHDPRYQGHKRDNPWTEAQIIEWLRGLGYKDSRVD